MWTVLLGFIGRGYGSGIPTWKLVIVSPTLFLKEEGIYDGSNKILNSTRDRRPLYAGNARGDETSLHGNNCACYLQCR